MRYSSCIQIGDGTNFVVVLCGEFLHQAEELLQVGLHTSEIISGYEKAGRKALEILEGMNSAPREYMNRRRGEVMSLVPV